MAQTSGDSKERVLSAALVLFSERGYGGTSLQAIGDRLGVTKAAVYYHYRAKAALLARLAEPFLGRMETLLDRRPNQWSQAGCRDLLDDYLDALLGARALAKVLIDDPTAANHPAAQRVRIQRRSFRDLLVSPRGDRRTGKVQASCALGALEGAVLDFGDTQPGRHRTTIINAAMGTLAAVPGARAPVARRR